MKKTQVEFLAEASDYIDDLCSEAIFTLIHQVKLGIRISVPVGVDMVGAECTSIECPPRPPAGRC